jgi:RNA-directed DNA polymerase
LPNVKGKRLGWLKACFDRISRGWLLTHIALDKVVLRKWLQAGYLEMTGRGLVCAQPLTLPDGWHLHHLQQRVYGGADAPYNLVLLHPNCHRQVHSQGLVVDKAASREGRS